MNLTIVNELTRRVSLVAPALLSGLLLLSACSSNQSGQSSAAPSDNSYSASQQAAAPASAGPSANAASAQAAPVSPAPVATTTPSPEHLAGVGSVSVVTIHGKIVSVDRPKKLVTLEGPAGKKVTLEVKNPYNLAAAKPGEPFVAKFYEVVTIRKKKPGESLPPVSTAQGIVSAMPGQTPGAALGNSVQLVATIVAINEDKKTVALKGPDGRVETVKVANPANLKHVKVGNDIVITLTKVMAISLEKESGA
jgi:hypothetical protein